MVERREYCEVHNRNYLIAGLMKGYAIRTGDLPDSESMDLIEAWADSTIANRRALIEFINGKARISSANVCIRCGQGVIEMSEAHGRELSLCGLRKYMAWRYGRRYGTWVVDSNIRRYGFVSLCMTGRAGVYVSECPECGDSLVRFEDARGEA